MSTKTKKATTPKRTLVDVDKLVNAAVVAWHKTDDSAEAGRVKAVRPLVGKVSQSVFGKAAGLSSSTVSRYYKAAGLANKHNLTAAEITDHAGDIVKAMKATGGPEALDKAADKATMFTTAGRLAAQKRVEDTRGSKGRGKGKGGTPARDTVATMANALRLRIEAATKGEADTALSSADVEALSRLVQSIAAYESVPPVRVARGRKAAAA